MSAKNVLLVEGESDRGFFEDLCKLWGVSLSNRLLFARHATPGTLRTRSKPRLMFWKTYLPQLAELPD